MIDSLVNSCNHEPLDLSMMYQEIWYEGVLVKSPHEGSAINGFKLCIHLHQRAGIGLSGFRVLRDYPQMAQPGQQGAGADDGADVRRLILHPTGTHL